MLLSTWRVQFPEFDAVSDPMAQAYLDAAALEVDLAVWGPKADQGIFYLAAHKLALSPYGQAARLAARASTKGTATTTYFEHFTNLVSQVTIGLSRVV